MLNSKATEPSPFRAGLVHGFLSVAVFAGLSALVGGVIHITGDPSEAGPQHVVALFETENDQTPALRTRSANGGTFSILATAGGDDVDASTEEPSLGVADPSRAPAAQSREPEVKQVQQAPRGIRINGKLVQPGQRYSQVEDSEAVPPKPAPPASSTQTAPTVRVNAVEPVQANYARPFENPEGKPVVSLIIGGLGTSYRQAISAIDELPENVTLSFVPTASNELLRYARKQGHEVLLEVPMEPLERGRARPHRDTLLANSGPADNVLRLKSLLRGRKELYGVITHKGDKFVRAEDSIPAILSHLHDNELAFFQHSTLVNTSFEAAAGDLNMIFAAGQENIDTEIRASAIEAKLFKLETQSLDEGMAFGTGFAYPQTVDIISRWSRGLKEKGILLAPASVVAAEGSRQRTAATAKNQLALNAVQVDPTP